MAAVSNETFQLSRLRLGLGLFLIFFFLSAVVVLIIIGIGSRWLGSGRLRLWAWFWGRIVCGILGVTPLVDLEVGDLVDGVFTACGRFFSAVIALMESGVSTVSVIPGGDHEAHATFDVSTKGPEVVLAASLHDDLVRALANSCAHFPELGVAGVGNELGLNGELVSRLDHGTIGTIGVLSVLLLALHVHVVLALALVITVAVGAGVGRHVEAIWVGLHDVDAGA